MQLWVHNQILCPITGKQTAIIVSLIRRNSTFEGYIAHLISLNKLKCGRGIMEAKEMVGPSKSDLGGMVILAIKKERATSSPTYVGGSLSETWNMYEKGHEKSMDNFPGGICTFLSLSGFVQFSWMTPLPNFSFKQDKLKWSRWLPESPVCLLSAEVFAGYLLSADTMRSRVGDVWSLRSCVLARDQQLNSK